MKRKALRIVGVWTTAAILVFGLSINVDAAAECQTVTISDGAITSRAGNEATIRTGLVGNYLWVQVGEYVGQDELEGTVSHEVPAGATGAVVCEDGSVTFDVPTLALSVGQETCPEGNGWVKVDDLSGTTYTYTPPAGFTVTDNCYKASTSVVFGSGPTVTSTVTNQNGQVQELSHASFLLVPITTTTEPPSDTTTTTTPSTSSPTTTTILTTSTPPSTLPSSTTTTEPNTDSTTSTTLAPTTTAPTTPSTSTGPSDPDDTRPERLPFTGVDGRLLAGIASLLLAAGGWVAWKGRSE